MSQRKLTRLHAGGASRLAGVSMVVLLGVALGTTGLAGCRAKSQALQLSVPWASGEVSRLKVTDNKTGAFVADWDIEVTVGNAGEWVITTRTTTPQVKDVTEVHVGATDLRPSLMDYRVEMAQGVATARAVYGDGKVAITADNFGKTETAEIKLPPPPYFDNDQFVMTLRALPLAESWRATLNDIVPKTGSKAQIAVEVAGKETVTVPAGTFECWHLQMKSIGQEAWIAVAPPHQLVQYGNGSAKTVCQLVEYKPGQ